MSLPDSTADSSADSEDWIPDDWLPNENEGDRKQQESASDGASGDVTSDESASDDDTPDDGTPDDAASETPPKKHSAELFPIPPAATAEGSDPQSADSSASTHPSTVGPLPLVETAFLASAASLMWLINTYFPPGPLLRILFPLPIALVYLRWNLRAAWMSATVAGLLLTILLGPTRSIFFVMPYGFLGVQLGCLWRRKASWGLSIFTGGVLVALGTFFRIWLLSLLAGEDLWGYLVAQITQFIDWIVLIFTNWGWIGLGSLGQPSMFFIAAAAVVMVLFSSMMYLFTVHLAAWLMLERLGVTMPEPPGWVQALIDE